MRSVAEESISDFWKHSCPTSDACVT